MIVELEIAHDEEACLEFETEKYLYYLDVLAVRKGTRTCTQHPISKFLGYGHLSKSMKGLMTQLSTTKIPNTFDEAWQDKN